MGLSYLTEKDLLFIKNVEEPFSVWRGFVSKGVLSRIAADKYLPGQKSFFSIMQCLSLKGPEVYDHLVDSKAATELFIARWWVMMGTPYGVKWLNPFEKQAAGQDSIKAFVKAADVVIASKSFNKQGSTIPWESLYRCHLDGDEEWLVQMLRKVDPKTHKKNATYAIKVLGFMLQNWWSNFQGPSGIVSEESMKKLVPMMLKWGQGNQEVLNEIASDWSWRAPLWMFDSVVAAGGSVEGRFKNLGMRRSSIENSCESLDDAIWLHRTMVSAGCSRKIWNKDSANRIKKMLMEDSYATSESVTKALYILGAEGLGDNEMAEILKSPVMKTRKKLLSPFTSVLCLNPENREKSFKSLLDLGYRIPKKTSEYPLLPKEMALIEQKTLKTDLKNLIPAAKKRRL